MRHVIYFDVETQRSAEEVGGWDHVERLGLALAVTYDTRDNTYKTYDEASVTNLVEALSAADLVIGFNHLKFDYRVLSAYTNADLQDTDRCASHRDRFCPPDATLTATPRPLRINGCRKIFTL